MEGSNLIVHLVLSSCVSFLTHTPSNFYCWSVERRKEKKKLIWPIVLNYSRKDGGLWRANQSSTILSGTPGPALFLLRYEYNSAKSASLLLLLLLLLQQLKIEKECWMRKEKRMESTRGTYEFWSSISTIGVRFCISLVLVSSASWLIIEWPRGEEEYLNQNKTRREEEKSLKERKR